MILKAIREWAAWLRSEHQRAPIEDSGLAPMTCSSPPPICVRHPGLKSGHALNSSGKAFDSTRPSIRSLIVYSFWSLIPYHASCTVKGRQVFLAVACSRSTEEKKTASQSHIGGRSGHVAAGSTPINITSKGVISRFPSGARQPHFTLYRVQSVNKEGEGGRGWL